MATLRYVALLAQDPPTLVDFYHRFLGTEELADRQTEIFRLRTDITI